MSEAPRELRLVLVEWLDSATPADVGWTWAEDVQHTCRILHHYTAGWLVDENDTQMVLAGCIGELQADDRRQINHLTAIPKRAVLNVKKLSRKRLW